jgi:hypothetical protein
VYPIKNCEIRMCVDGVAFFAMAAVWLSAEDAEADLVDFEEMLDALVRLEAGCMLPGEHVPRVHFMRQLVFECLVPWSTDAPDVVDAEGVLQDKSQRTLMQHRVEALLEAFLACQTLHMCEEDVRVFYVTKTVEQRRDSAVFLRLASRYRAEFGAY